LCGCRLYLLLRFFVTSVLGGIGHWYKWAFVKRCL